MQSGSPSASKSGGTLGRKAQLEAMSHEDLVQNCLKQTVLLQKLKARYDEVQKFAALSKENEARTAELQAKIDSGAEEKKQLMEDLKLSQKNFSSTKDELECMKMKLETLMSSVQCIREEKDELFMKNKDATQKLNEISEKLCATDNEKQEIEDRLKDSEQQCSGLKNHIKTMTEKVQASENSAKVIGNLRNEIAALNITVSALKQQKASGSDSGPDTFKLKATIVELKKRLKAQQETNKAFTKDVAEREAQNEILLNEMEALKSDSEEYRSFKASLEEKFSVGVPDVFKIIENARKKGEEKLLVEKEKDEVAARLHALLLEKNEFVEKIASLEECSRKQKEHFEEENQTFQSQIQALENQLQNTSHSKEDKENLPVQIKHLQEENSKLIQGLKKAKKQFEDSCKDFESAQEKLKASVDILEEEKIEFNRKLEDVEKKLYNSNEQKSSIQKEMEEQINTVKNVNLDLVDQNECLKLQVKESLKKDDALKELGENIQKLEQENRKLRDDMQQSEAKLFEGEENREKKENCLKSQIIEKEAELREKVKFMDENKEKHDALQEKIQNLMSQKELLLEEKGQLDSLVKEYVVKIEDLESLVIKYDKESSLLREGVEEKNRELKEFALKANNFERETNDLLGEMVKKDELCENLQREVVELKGKCVVLEDTLSMTNKGLSTELENAKQNMEKIEFDEQAKMNASLQLEVKILNDKLDEKQQEVQRIKEDVYQQKVPEEDENEGKILKLWSELEDFKTMHQNLTKEFEDLYQENSMMKEEVSGMQSQVGDLKKKYDDLESLKQEREEDFACSRQEMVNSVSKLKESQAEVLTRLQEEHDAEMKIVKEKTESLETEKNNYELQLSRLESDHRELKSSIGSLAEANKKLQDEVVDFQDQIRIVEQERRKIVSENESNLSALAEMRENLRLSEEKVKELEDDKEKILELLSTAEKKLESEREVSEKSIEDLKSIIAEKDSCLNEGATQNASKTEDSKRMLAEIQKEKYILLEEMENAKTNHQAKITQLEERESEITKQLKESQMNFEDLQLKFSDLSAVLEMEKNKNSDTEEAKESFAKLQESFFVLEKERTDILRDLEDVNSKNVDLEEEVKSFQSRETDRESAFVTMKEEFESMRTKLEETATELSCSRGLCSQLEQRVEQVTIQLDAKTKVEVEPMQKSEDNSEQKKVFEKALKEKDEYCNKLKMIAVKAKKEYELAKKKLRTAEEESTALTTKVQTLSTQLQGSQTQASNVQMMQIECDKLQDQLDQTQAEKKAVEKNLDDVVMQLKDAQAEKNDLESTAGQWKAKHDQVTMEKNDASKLLTMTKATMEMLESERNRQSNEIEAMKKGEETLKERISSLEEQLSKEKSSLEDTKHHLSEAKKGMKQHDMLTLEMAQYERTVSELQQTARQLEESLKSEKENSNGLTERLSKLHEDRNATEQFRLEAEDRANQANQQFASCKEEIANLQAEAEELRIRLADMTSQVQDTQHETEQFKLELSNSSSEVSRLQQKILSMESAHGRSSDIMQRKSNSLQADLDYLKNEKDNLETEYEGYKVRVHTVLKQQKSKGQEQEKKSEEEQKILQLTSSNDQLMTKLAEVRDKIQLQENELQLANADYERLMKQHEQDKERAAEREGRWKGRVQDLQLELSTLQRQYAEVATQTNRKNDSLSFSHKREIESLNQLHEKELENASRKLAGMENELLRLQAEKASISHAEAANRVTSTPKRSTEPSSPVLSSGARIPSTEHMQHHRHHSHHQALDLRSVAREDGEGQENPEVSQTFERLLSTSTEIKAVSVISDLTATSEARERNLEAKYEAQSKKLDHLSEVVRENEATVSRLTEQNRVLKEEIRRLEKNQERETSVANMEYLKNVLYKFITLPPGDEKRHLLPVMDTMLKFDPKERAILQGMAADDAGTEGQKGWSGYFQRWSGLQ